MVKNSIIMLFCAACLLVACKSSPRDLIGVVSTASPEASKVGALILEKGGNAVDAAIAISLALGVTEPAMSGLGGGTQVLLSIPGKDPTMINGTTYSPSSTPAGIQKSQMKYHQRSTVPSTLKVLDYLFRNYSSGNLSWSELVQPSIDLAEKGFEVGEFRRKVYERYSESLKNSPYHTNFWLIDGKVPTKGQTLVQPQFAKTMMRIQEYGADDFYSGWIASKISEDMEENGGWISKKDLNGFPDPVEIPALEVNYKGYKVYTSTPPCGGWTMLMILKLFEIGDDDKFENLVNALFVAHNERKSNPVINLVDFDSEIKNKLSTSYLEKIFTPIGSTILEEEANGETTHFSVVDSSGIGVAVTASINAYFGAKAASPELGFLYNTYMDDFVFDDPDNTYAIGPGKMAYSSMTPTIVKYDGNVKLILGSPGSARIISTVAQVIDIWIDSQDIINAVGQARVHVNGEKVYIEETNPPSNNLRFLDQNNYQLTNPSNTLMLNNLNAYFGGVHAIAFENNQWVGAADPRRDGEAIVVLK